VIQNECYRRQKPGEKIPRSNGAPRDRSGSRAGRSGGDYRAERFGKTTLLRSINLLEQPEGGTIRVGEITIDTGKSISQQKG
jgi:hypothetical protein